LTPEKRAHIELHIAVFLFGFTAILGHLISLSATVLVWWRVLFTVVSLAVLLPLLKVKLNISRKQVIKFILIGFIVGIHWVFFYASIKAANASIALICLATIAVFTSIIEPVVLRKPFKRYELLLGSLVIPGMALVVSVTDSSMNYGILLGISAAFLSALFSVLNKKYVADTSPYVMTFVELAGAVFILTVCVGVLSMTHPDTPFWPEGWDWFYLLVLSLLCTTAAFLLSLRSLRYISAFTANLAINLEPVYGIVLAVLILKENKELNIWFYIGVLIILCTLFAYPLLKKKYH